MALPRVALVLGDSFIRRLRKFVLVLPSILALISFFSNFAVIKWHSIGGRKVTKTVQHDLHVIKSFKIVHLGSNNLTSETALRVGPSIYDFVRLLHNLYHVQVIYVCQNIMHQGLSAFNHKAKLLTKYLRVVLEPVPYAHFWGHSGCWHPSNDKYTFAMVFISP